METHHINIDRRDESKSIKLSVSSENSFKKIIKSDDRRKQTYYSIGNKTLRKFILIKREKQNDCKKLTFANQAEDQIQ